MLGAYAAWVFHTYLWLGLLASLVPIFLVVAAFGWVIERYVLSLLNTRPLDTILATWGVGIMLQQAVRLMVGSELRYVQLPPALSDSMDVFGIPISSYRVFLFVVSIALFGATWLLMNRTTVGMKLRAIIQDRSVAASFGINAKRVYALTFAYGAGLAGLAGALVRVPALAAGQIFAAMGLKDTKTGYTLTAPGHPLLLERIGGYEPVISQAIETQSLRERDLLLEALARVADKDPSFRYGEDKETGQLLVSGQGELHLEIVAERLRREFGIPVRTGQPQVLLRETLTAEAEGEGRFERTLEEEQIFGQVSVRVAPLPRGAGFRFRLAPEAAGLPFLRGETLEMVEQGAREAARGPSGGHRLVFHGAPPSKRAWPYFSARKGYGPKSSEKI